MKDNFGMTQTGSMLGCGLIRAWTWTNKGSLQKKNCVEIFHFFEKKQSWS